MRIKILITSIIITLSALVAQAQWGVGFKIGGNITTSSQPEYLEAMFGEINSRTNFTGGMRVGYTFNRFLDVDAELLFTAKGFNQEGFYTQTATHIARNLVVTSYYLELPLMAKIFPVRELGLNVQFGPNFGVLAYRYRSVTTTYVNHQYEVQGDKWFNFGVNVGIGYEHEQGFFTDLRYTHDLNDNFKRTDGEDGFRESTVSLCIGYTF